MLKDRPEALNLLGIYSDLLNQSLDDTLKAFEGRNFSDFKNKLSEKLVSELSPVSEKINKLLSDKLYLDTILEEGGKKASEIASKKVIEMKKILGF